MEHNIEHMMPQQCPLCNGSADCLTTTPIGGQHDRMILHVTCGECQAALVLFVIQNEVGVLTCGVLTDTHSTEAQKFFGHASVNYDDVIAMHHYLQKDQDVKQDLLG